MRGRWVSEPSYYRSKRTGEIYPCLQPRAERCRAKKASADAAMAWLRLTVKPWMNGPERAKVYREALAKGATLSDIARVVETSRQAVQQVIQYYDRRLTKSNY